MDRLSSVRGNATRAIRSTSHMTRHPTMQPMSKRETHSPPRRPSTLGLVPRSYHRVVPSRSPAATVVPHGPLPMVPTRTGRSRRTLTLSCVRCDVTWRASASVHCWSCGRLSTTEAAAPIVKVVG